ncbi:MAG: enoyl-CoA hydratase [Candidatus Binatota bacterium]|nr:enoyl-CoA hydratase [Candidatus Binatota bacterium]
MATTMAGVRFALEGRVARLTLAAPDRGNRFSPAMALELADACERCEDDDVWVVRLDAEGKDFCLGVEGDSKEWPELAGADFVAALARITRPIVATVQGRAESEGLELALAADLRIVGPATVFSMRQVEHGSLPRFGGTQRLPRIVGVERAFRAILLGEAIDGREALSVGLAARLDDDLDRAAADVAATLAARGPVALRFAKEAVRRAPDLALDDGARFEHDLYSLLQTTRDRAEGIRAFLEKRKPEFHGD